MIKLNLKYNFKSLEPFQIELPDFVIFTGLNGAGKTQILNAILNESLILTDENNNELNPKKYVTSQTLAPNNGSIVTREQLNSNVQKLWNQFSISQGSVMYLGSHNSPQNVFGDPDSPQMKAILEISKFANKEVKELTQVDFHNYYPLHDVMQETDIFHQNFSNLFKRYQDRIDDNEYRQFKNQQKGDENSHFLSDEDFIVNYGEAPWLFVNKILSKANLDYHLELPKKYNRNAPYQLSLVNKNSGAQIDFVDLSSGEKVLMSLALALYNSNFDIQFPKVLLMDEPDASLHPSMSKKFLDVIKEVFVIQKGVKVIMTTHSPSTVALAPEETIFIVNNMGTRIEKSTKDKALKILTSGVPAFSVNYENRRQVFVESPNDVLFYEKIYQKLSAELTPEISLSFISSGDSRTDRNGMKISNCGQVENITEILRDAGNKFIWGIIDWDSKNDGSDFVKVLGNGNRYAIENYLFDPILVCALLLREKIIEREDIGLHKNESYTDFKDLSFNQLQVISNFVTDKVFSIVNPKEISTKKTQLLNGIEIEIPIWYLHHNGHKLEEVLIKTFPGLGALKRGKEEALKLEIINKVIDDVPELISKDFLEIFKNIQSP